MKYVYYVINRLICKAFEKNMPLNNGDKMHVIAIEFVSMQYEHPHSYGIDTRYTLCDDNGNTQQFLVHGLEYYPTKRLLKNTLLKNKDLEAYEYHIRIGRSGKNQVHFVVSRIEIIEGTRVYRERHCYKGSMYI